MAIKDAETYGRVRHAFCDGLERVRNWKASEKLMMPYYEFPEMGHFESGLPHFGKRLGVFDRAPIDYKSVFREENQPGSIPSWADLATYAQQNPVLRGHFGFDDADPAEEGPITRWKLVEFGVFSSVEHLLDHYIHTNKTMEFSEEAFLRLYRLWENSVYCDELHFDILIPIIYITCEFDSMELDHIAIERLTEEVQLARSIERSYSVAVHDSVVGAATHALVLRNWYIKNPGRVRHSLTSADAFSQPLRRVDNFFAALRAVTGYDTGYGQVVIRPIDWADRWHAVLPDLYAFSVRAYPDRFENYGWLREPPVLTGEQCAGVGTVFKAIDEAKSKGMAISARRLNAALLRSDEEDAILDVTIGLETLLASDSRSEMTYRLAVRLAALCKLRPFESLTPSRVFGITKELYDFRSAVVHGSAKVDTKRVVRLVADQPIPAITLGISLLRHVILLLAERPEYLDVRRIDSELLDRA